VDCNSGDNDINYLFIVPIDYTCMEMNELFLLRESLWFNFYPPPHYIEEGKDLSGSK